MSEPITLLLGGTGIKGIASIGSSNLFTATELKSKKLSPQELAYRLAHNLLSEKTLTY